MKEKKTHKFLLNIDSDLFLALKEKAFYERKTMTSIVLELIKIYVDEDEDLDQDQDFILE